MDHAKTERYVRWQGYRINQLSFSINLFLGFAVASIAFVVNIKLGSKPHAAIPINTVIAWWSASAFLGAVAIVTKLLDYRSTARKIKYSSACHKKFAKVCGYVTWGCFWSQLLTYAYGAFRFVAGLMAE